MSPDEIAEWLSFGMRLKAAGEEKYAEVVASLELVVAAQETLAEFDWQLMFRSRPGKQYTA
jgi:hypothetical protein